MNVIYIIELTSKEDGLAFNIFCKEENLAKLIDHYDKKRFQLTNVYGIGSIYLDYSDFLEKTNNLELGG